MKLRHLILFVLVVDAIAPDVPGRVLFMQSAEDMKGSEETVSETLSGPDQVWPQCGFSCASKPASECSSFAFNKVTLTCIHYDKLPDQMSLTSGKNFVLMKREMVCQTSNLYLTAATLSFTKQYDGGFVPNGAAVTVVCDSGFYIPDTVSGTTTTSTCVQTQFQPALPSCTNQQWKAVIRTGSAEVANGPNGEIYIVIKGKKGNSRQIFLSNGQTNFLRDGTDTFTFSTMLIGNLDRVKIGTLSSSNGWQLDRLTVTNLLNGNKHKFTDEIGSGLWFKDDGVKYTKRTLTPD